MNPTEYVKAILEKLCVGDLELILHNYVTVLGNQTSWRIWHIKYLATKVAFKVEILLFWGYSNSYSA